LTFILVLRDWNEGTTDEITRRARRQVRFIFWMLFSIGNGGYVVWRRWGG